MLQNVIKLIVCIYFNTEHLYNEYSSHAIIYNYSLLLRSLHGYDLVRVYWPRTKSEVDVLSSGPGAIKLRLTFDLRLTFPLYVPFVKVRLRSKVSSSTFYVPGVRSINPCNDRYQKAIFDYYYYSKTNTLQG